MESLIVHEVGWQGDNMGARPRRAGVPRVESSRFLKKAARKIFAPLSLRR
jgi:hypothetical protein